MEPNKPLVKISDYLTAFSNDMKEWGEKSLAWFRGQKDPKETPEFGHLVPAVYKLGYSLDVENDKYQMFRMKAPAFEDTPEFSRIDLWYFLMQHYGMATRLLDWSESAFIAAYFAIHGFKYPTKMEQERSPHILKEIKYPSVWMMSPSALNSVSKIEEFRLPWKGYLAAFQNTSPCPISNIRAAFTKNIDLDHNKYPEALFPNISKIRMAAQKSCFTIHGESRLGIDKMFAELCEFIEVKKYIKNYIFEFDNQDQVTDALFELKLLGVTQSTLFPDLENLGKELKETSWSLF